LTQGFFPDIYQKNFLATGGGMKTGYTVMLGFLLFMAQAVASVDARAEDRLKVGMFNRDAVNVIAEAKGFLQGENVSVDIMTANNSVDLMRNFIGGKTDIIHTNADNVIAWAEGQGEDPKPNDFVIFLGGNQGVRQRLVVGPGIGSIGDLKGKVLAVDDPRTGYASVLVYMLKKNGLILNRDFTLKAVGNTKSRAESMARGETAGALINMPEEDIRKRGFKIVGMSEDYVPVYARGVAAARKTWAQQHEDLLVRYSRAIIRTTDWILDPRNKKEALVLLLPANENSPSSAERMYEDAVNPTLGYIIGSRIERAGIQAVIELREAMGFLKAPLPSPDRYVDERYYQAAAASLGKR
jgi:ABC-type nitrate/sulfonate/bicarbonate transport system substrate-binding protein